QKPVLSFISSPDVTIDSAINTSSTFVAFTVEVSLADNPPAKISLGYPGNSIKYILARFKQKQWEKPLDFSRLSNNLLSKIVIPATATLGQTSLTTSEIDQLEVGDVVSLGTTINSAVELQVGDILKALCQPGKKDKKAAVKIAAISEEEHIEIAPPSLTELAQTPVGPETSLEMETPQPEIEAEPEEQEELEEKKEPGDFSLDEEDLTDEDLFLEDEEELEDEEDEEGEEDEEEEEEDEEDEDI
ncbi:MAG: FliM/FliN family flagellar motor C-terminal domain-containing protein, partial [Candidatus Margulisbacteria bacterium]|nr:FliM/FliN family flagellar motor C-terminal domain-containing protein [Candidatus Margulisiibacteriota bacterium]